MADMKWISCPFCSEIADLHRQGPVGVIVPAKKQDHMKVLHSKRVKCGYCNKVFFSDGATIFESMGRDTLQEVPY
jgi:uncharacterized Zn-finger protein